MKWPVLDAGGPPPIDLSTWEFDVAGLVQEVNLTLIEDLTLANNVLEGEPPPPLAASLRSRSLVSMADLDPLLELAGLAGAGLTTLPKDRDLLKKRIDKSIKSFAAAHPSQMTGTPTLYLKKGGTGSLQYFGTGLPDLGSLEAAIDALLK